VDVDGHKSGRVMELVVLFIICAVLFLGPRKCGRMPSKIAMALGACFCFGSW
jgi:hypothetical protein